MAVRMIEMVLPQKEGEEVRALLQEPSPKSSVTTPPPCACSYRGSPFVSIFRACAESLASENASRLAAMQRADKNIDDLLEGFKSAFHRVRQKGIDEELFDVIAGFEALAPEKSHRGTGRTRRNRP